MNIYVYWNRKDNDCAKIFHFMSKNDKHSLLDDLVKNHNVEIQPIYNYYSDSTKIMNEIQNNELIILLTHGTENEILKYRNDPEKNFREYVLIDSTNVDVFKDKIVLAFCCSSACYLGRYSVTPNIGCKAFIGFENDIVYDNGKAERSRHIIYESYKIAFMKSLRYALENKCTVREYQIKLKQLMRKESMNAILEVGDRSLNTMYSGSINGAIALGNTDAIMFT